MLESPLTVDATEDQVSNSDGTEHVAFENQTNGNW